MGPHPPTPDPVHGGTGLRKNAGEGELAPNQEDRKSGKPRSRLRRWGPLVAALFLICIPLGWLAATSFGSSGSDPIAQAAIAYSRGQIIWDSGPTVQSVHIVPMRDLSRALAAYAPPQISPNINVTDLSRRYGPTFRVGVVVLHGDFNSLPPGEGITLHYAIVLVNTRTNKGFFLMD